jgi:hypothetical protein
MTRVTIDGIETDMMWPVLYSFHSADGGDWMFGVRHISDTDGEWAAKVEDMARNGYFMDPEQPGTDDASRREALKQFVAAQKNKDRG